MKTREAPHFWGLHKNMNCAFPLRVYAVISLFIIILSVFYSFFFEKLFLKSCSRHNCFWKFPIHKRRRLPCTNFDLRGACLSNTLLETSIIFLEGFLQNFVLRTLPLSHSDSFHYKKVYSFFNVWLLALRFGKMLS